MTLPFNAGHGSRHPDPQEDWHKVKQCVLQAAATHPRDINAGSLKADPENVCHGQSSLQHSEPPGTHAWNTLRKVLISRFLHVDTTRCDINPIGSIWDDLTA